MAIGAEKLGEFCEKHHIVNVISGDLHDPEAIAALRKHGVKLARSVNYKMNEDDIQRCINTDGFTYMQAFPSEGQYVKPGFEELETCIRYLRERKVSSRSTAARALSLRRTQRASRPREARASLSEAPLLNCTTRRKNSLS